MPANRRTPRDERRRRLGQNFLRPDAAERFVDEAGLAAGDFVVEIGAGSGAITQAIARRGVDVLAVEMDPVWAERLRVGIASEHRDRVRVVTVDILRMPLPEQSFRVVACIPFGVTTAILSRLLDDPAGSLRRADLIVQWEVACKRSATPATTLRSTVWAPWWEFRLGHRIAAADFRPIPRVDGGVLRITRRDVPLLPPAMAARYTKFVRANWPFPATTRDQTMRRSDAQRASS